MASTTESPRIRALRSAPLNAWIALSEDESRIIATGSTYEEAVEKSERAGASDPIIIKTPMRWPANPMCFELERITKI